MWSPFADEEKTRRPVPDNSVSLDWFLGLTGVLADGEKSSTRFRENVESPNIRLAEIEAWVLQALADPQTEQKLFALQDLVNSVAKRMTFGVHYGCYDDSRSDWLHFDGLWQIDTDLFATVEIASKRLEKVDLVALAKARELLCSHQDWVAHAQLVHVFLLADGADARVRDEIRRSEMHDGIRFLPLETLFELAQLHEESVITRRQLPVLFRPVDASGIHGILTLIEEFTALFDETANGFAPDPPRAVLKAASPAPTDDEESLDAILRLFETGDRREGRERLTRFLERHPADEGALSFQTDLLVNEGRIEEALKPLRVMVEANPHSETTAVRLATLLGELDRWPEALDVLEPPSRTSSPGPKLLLLRADCLRRCHRADEAEALFRRLTETNPGDPTPWMAWLDMLRDEGRLEDGRSLLERARREIEDPERLDGYDEAFAP